MTYSPNSEPERSLIDALRSDADAPVEDAIRSRVARRLGLVSALGVASLGMAAESGVRLAADGASAVTKAAALAGQSAAAGTSTAGLLGGVMAGLGLGMLAGGALLGALQLAGVGTERPAPPAAATRSQTQNAAAKAQASGVASPAVERREVAAEHADDSSAALGGHAMTAERGVNRAQPSGLALPTAPRRVPTGTPTHDAASVERALLERAHATFARGEVGQALEQLALHRRRFPNGTLTEEREALSIKVLLASDQAAAARARLTDFEQRFPRSLFLPTLRAPLERKP